MSVFSVFPARTFSETVDLFAHLEKILRLVSTLFAVNGEAEHVDFIDSSVTEEEDPSTPPLTAPPLVPVIHRLISTCVRSSCCSTSCLVCCLRTGKLLIVSLISRRRRRALHRPKPRTQQYAGKCCRTYCQRYSLHGTANS